MLKLIEHIAIALLIIAAVWIALALTGGHLGAI
jgi:hypothetical protein